MYKIQLPLMVEGGAAVSTKLEDMTRGTAVTAMWNGSTTPMPGDVEAPLIVFASADWRSLFYFIEDHYDIVDLSIEPSDFYEEV